MAHLKAVLGVAVPLFKTNSCSPNTASLIVFWFQVPPGGRDWLLPFENHLQIMISRLLTQPPELRPFVPSRGDGCEIQVITLLLLPISEAVFLFLSTFLFAFYLHFYCLVLSMTPLFLLLLGEKGKNNLTTFVVFHLPPSIFMTSDHGGPYLLCPTSIKSDV